MKSKVVSHSERRRRAREEKTRGVESIVCKEACEPTVSHEIVKDGSHKTNLLHALPFPRASRSRRSCSQGPTDLLRILCQVLVPLHPPRCIRLFELWPQEPLSWRSHPLTTVAAWAPLIAVPPKSLDRSVAPGPLHLSRTLGRHLTKP